MISGNLLAALFEQVNQPPRQTDHFASSHVLEMFNSKVARSPATGKDGLRVWRFAEIAGEEARLIERKVLGRTYEFTAFKERLVLRGAHREPRQISIPTVRDRLTLRVLCELLHTHVPRSLGSPPHALVDKVVKSVREPGSEAKFFVRVDVKNFFPSIVHARLQKSLARAGIEEFAQELCLKAVRTKTGSTDSGNVRGVPQGLSISTALSAIYMFEFDEKQFKEHPSYVRYVDDILMLCDPGEAASSLKALTSSLNRIGLSAHREGVAGKTEIKPVSEGIDFLGYHICADMISIRESSYRRMFGNLLKVITDYRYRNDTDRLIFRLNLKITGCIIDGRKRGWMMFFSRTQNVSQLMFLDQFVVSQLKRVKFPEGRKAEIKRFVKSYHQIRFNLTDTSYIPNLDDLSFGEKADIVSKLSGKTLAEVSTWNIEAIDQEFSRLVSKEVLDLEKDVGSPS